MNVYEAFILLIVCYFSVNYLFKHFYNKDKKVCIKDIVEIDSILDELIEERNNRVFVIKGFTKIDMLKLIKIQKNELWGICITVFFENTFFNEEISRILKLEQLNFDNDSIPIEVKIFSNKKKIKSTLLEIIKFDFGSNQIKLKIEKKRF